MYKRDIGFLFAILKMCDDIESYKKDYNNIRELLIERMICSQAATEYKLKS